MNNWSTATQYANLSIYSNNEIVSSKKRETSATRALELDDGWENNSNIYLLSYQPKKKVNTNKKEDDENRKLTIDEINCRMQQLLMERSNISRNDAPRQQQRHKMVSLEQCYTTVPEKYSNNRSENY